MRKFCCCCCWPSILFLRRSRIRDTGAGMYACVCFALGAFANLRAGECGRLCVCLECACASL